MTPRRDTQIVINGAAGRPERRPRALDADYAQVDGRSLSELLDFAVEFGSLINFYNLKDEADGDWVLFFLTDPTVLLASQAATDLPGLEGEFARLERLTLEAQSFETKYEFLRQTFEVIHGVARQLDLRLRLLQLRSEGETMRLLRQALVTEVETGLGERLRRLKAYDLGAGHGDALGHPIGLNYEGFSPLWELEGVGPDRTIYRGRTSGRRIARAVPHLAALFDPFLYALSDLKLFAQANLPATLEADDHKPQVALYIAFTSLFRTAQQTINTFSSRYVNFYYRDILRAAYRAAIPDKVFLAFALREGEGVPSTTVPRNTLFPAGQDHDGRDILYGSDKDLLVTGARIAELRTLRVTRGGLIPAEPGSPEVVRRVLSSEISEAASAGAPWDTFGAARVGETEGEVTQPATLGFALASPYLWMTGGVRDVRVGLYCSGESRSKLVELLESLSLATSLPPEAIFETVLLGAFTLYVSMSAGWFRIKNYVVGALALGEPDAPVFELKFELPANVPPVAAYDPALAGEVDDGSAKVVTDDAVVNASNPAPTLPTLKAYLCQNAVSLNGVDSTVEVYPLSLLGEIELTAFQINADVYGLAGLQLTNTDGEIDTSSPFPLFGGMPALGSYLLIRHAELFSKTLDRLWLTITWFNLPPNEDGFQGYYKDYVIGLDGEPQPGLFNNAVFHGGLSVQNPGRWFLSGQPKCPDAPPAAIDLLLFRTQPLCDDTAPAGALCSFTNFDALTVCRWTPPPYYDAAGSAIKLELTAPPYAFGNDLYAQNVLNSVLEDLPDTELCQEKCLSQCQLLSEASLCIEGGLVCLAGCGQQPGGPTPQCVEACLSGCLGCLLDKAIRCLTRCLEEAAGLPIENTLLNIRTQLTNCRDRPLPEQTQCIEASLQLLADCLDLYGESIPECAKECIRECMTILQAAQCVSLAAGGCGGQVECLINELTGCKQQLDAAYAACIEKCMNDCLSLKKPLKYPNEPYLPQATSVIVNYSAHCASRPAEAGEACGLFFHLLPFDGSNQLEPSAEEPTPMLPHFSHAGNLYIGFSALVPPQTLTLLFQMASSPHGDRSVEPAPVVWEYLSDNRWLRLPPSAILADSTNGLQNSGVVTLSLPRYDPLNNTVLAADKQWLRASVVAGPDQFPQTVNIFPHAVLAAWRDDDNTGAHLAKPLPPYTINAAVEDLPAIAAVIQPMQSFGGRPPETGNTFDIRVGERLRHKERAILGWDYERLVLERFPTVWKTQALPARNPTRGDEPGSVLVVIVPGPDSVEVMDSTAPTATGELLEQIQTYLEGLVSPFVRLYVVNPLYVRIQVSTTVQFRAGSDAGDYTEQLNKELIEYLSPWYYDAGRAATRGRYISEADISEFIQTRPYVELMLAIALGYEPPRDTLDWYFLTSAQQHQIHVADAAGVSESNFY